VAILIAACAQLARAQSTAASASSDSSPLPTVATAFSYTGEVVADAAGGVHRGATYTGGAAAQITVALGRISGWPGLELFVFVLDSHGGAPSERVGDVQGVSNLQAPARLRLEEIWLQHNGFGNHLSVLAGRYDLNSEFYRLQSAGLFVNSSFGIGPELAQSGVEGPSIFPNTSVGARLAYKSSPNAVLRVAVLDGIPVYRAHGAARFFAPGDGAFLVGEMTIVERPDSGGTSHNPRFRIGRGIARPYTGKVAVGAWYYTARFPDLIDTLATGEPVQHRGSGGAYVIADRIFWSAKNGGPASLSAFVQLGLGDSRVDQIGGYAGGGFTFTAPIASRPRDEVGLAIASARTGSQYEKIQMASGFPVNSETTVELTYLVQLGSWLAVQPDLQYVRHPANAPAARYALVPGLRVALSH
jgi:porin